MAPSYKSRLSYWSKAAKMQDNFQSSIGGLGRAGTPNSAIEPIGWVLTGRVEPGDRMRLERKEAVESRMSVWMFMVGIYNG